MYATHLFPSVPLGVRGSHASRTTVHTKFILTNEIVYYWLLCLLCGFVIASTLDNAFSPEPQWVCTKFCFDPTYELNPYQLVDADDPGPAVVRSKR